LHGFGVRVEFRSSGLAFISSGVATASTGSRIIFDVLGELHMVGTSVSLGWKVSLLDRASTTQVYTGAIWQIPYYMSQGTRTRHREGFRHRCGRRRPLIVTSQPFSLSRWAKDESRSRLEMAYRSSLRRRCSSDLPVVRTTPPVTETSSRRRLGTDAAVRPETWRSRRNQPPSRLLVVSRRPLA
jgi:hypothetical protein